MFKKLRPYLKYLILVICLGNLGWYFYGSDLVHPVHVNNSAQEGTIVPAERVAVNTVAVEAVKPPSTSAADIVLPPMPVLRVPASKVEASIEVHENTPSVDECWLWGPVWDEARDDVEELLVDYGDKFSRRMKTIVLPQQTWWAVDTIHPVADRAAYFLRSFGDAGINIKRAVILPDGQIQVGLFTDNASAVVLRKQMVEKGFAMTIVSDTHARTYYVLDSPDGDEQARLRAFTRFFGETQVTSHPKCPVDATDLSAPEFWAKTLKTYGKTNG